MTIPATPMGRALDLVMWFGAARADATPEQVGSLREIVDNLMPRYKSGEVSEEQVKEAIGKVMGQEWRPSREWTLVQD